MLLEIDFAKKKKKQEPPLATVMTLFPVESKPAPQKKKKNDEHLTLSI